MALGLDVEFVIASAESPSGRNVRDAGRVRGPGSILLREDGWMTTARFEVNGGVFDRDGTMAIHQGSRSHRGISGGVCRCIG